MQNLKELKQNKTKIDRDDRINLNFIILKNIKTQLEKDKKNTYTLLSIFRILLFKLDFDSKLIFKEAKKYHKKNIIFRKNKEDHNDYSLKTFIKNILLDKSNSFDDIKKLISKTMRLVKIYL